MKQIVIFFCGPDMCGKTNISQALAQQLNVPYFKAKNEHRNFLSEGTNFINDLRYSDPRMVDFLSQTQHSVVFDRGFPCEWVYAKDRGRDTDEDALSFLDQAYANLGAVIVFCHRQNYEGKVDDLDPTIDEHKLKQLDTLYTEFLSTTKCKVIDLVVDEENLKKQVYFLLEELIRIEAI